MIDYGTKAEVMVQIPTVAKSFIFGTINFRSTCARDAIIENGVRDQPEIFGLHDVNRMKHCFLLEIVCLCIAFWDNFVNACNGSLPILSPCETLNILFEIKN